MSERKVNRKGDRETEIQKVEQEQWKIFQLRAGKHSTLQGDREGKNTRVASWLEPINSPSRVRMGPV